MQERLTGYDWETFMEYQRGEHDKFRLAKNMADEINSARHPIDKTTLAMQVVEEYSGLVDVLGYTKASEEMATALGEYVLHAELNEFEADMIATLAILGKVATYALNENEELRNGRL